MENANDENQYEKGKLYKFNGLEFEEISPNDDVEKLPVTKHAKDIVQEMRKQIHAELKRQSPDKQAKRPELDIVASILLMQGAKCEVKGLAEAVRECYRNLY